MTSKRNLKVSLGLTALLCGLLAPSAIGASGNLQTFQLKLHQGINTLAPVDPVNKPGLFNMFDVGEATLLGRYVNTGLVQMVPIQDPPGFAILFGAGTLTAANGDSIAWQFQPTPEHPDRIVMLPSTGTGRFKGATGYIDNFAISVTPNPNGTVTIVHWAQGELTVPKNRVTRQIKMEAHSQMVLNLANGSYQSKAEIIASHCGQSVGLGWGLFGGAGAGEIIAANGDKILFDSPTTVLQGIITDGTGRFAGARGEFNIVALEQTGTDPGPEPGTVTLSFVWSAMGTITY